MRVQLPTDAVLATDAVLTRGGRVRQGWKTPDGRFFETFHYPGALNFQNVIELQAPPPWEITGE